MCFHEHTHFIYCIILLLFFVIRFEFSYFHNLLIYMQMVLRTLIYMPRLQILNHY